MRKTMVYIPTQLTAAPIFPAPIKSLTKCPVLQTSSSTLVSTSAIGEMMSARNAKSSAVALALLQIHLQGMILINSIIVFLSLGDLPPGKSKCSTTPLVSMLCLFLEFPVSVLHHPVHKLLSRSSSSSPPFHQGGTIV